MKEKTKLTWRDPSRRGLAVADFLIFVAIFLLAAGIRSYPEIKAGYFPIGYDTLNSYLPALAKFDGNFGRWILGSDLFYILIWPFIKIFHGDPSISLKVAGCVLYGGLAGSLYLFSRKYLNWGIWQGLLVGLLFMVQLPALRLSWDLFRNMLALIFLLPAIYCLFTNHKVKNLIWLLVFSFLIVLSNPLISGLWFVLVVVWLIHKLWLKDWRNMLLIFLSVLPAVLLFIFMIKAQAVNNFGGRVFYQGEPERVWSYFTAYAKTMPFTELKATIFSMFWFYFQFIIGPALYGLWLMRKNLLLSTLTLWLLLGSFSSLVFNGFGLFVWDRWMIMLVLPFTIYAVAGLWDVGIRINKLKIFKKIKISYRKILLTTLAIIFWLALIGLFVWKNFLFVSVPSQYAKLPYLNSQINAYLPPSMINNAVGFENIKDVLNCIDYLNEQAPDESILVIDNRYRGMALLNFDYSKGYIYSYAWSPQINQKTLYNLQLQTEGPVYTIWNAAERPKNFNRAYTSGQLTVYRDAKTYKIYQEGQSKD